MLSSQVWAQARSSLVENGGTHYYLSECLASLPVDDADVAAAAASASSFMAGGVGGGLDPSLCRALVWDIGGFGLFPISVDFASPEYRDARADCLGQLITQLAASGN